MLKELILHANIFIFSVFTEVFVEWRLLYDIIAVDGGLKKNCY